MCTYSRNHKVHEEYVDTLTLFSRLVSAVWVFFLSFLWGFDVFTTRANFRIAKRMFWEVFSTFYAECSMSLKRCFARNSCFIIYICVTCNRTAFWGGSFFLSTPKQMPRWSITQHCLAFSNFHARLVEPVFSAICRTLPIRYHLFLIYSTRKRWLHSAWVRMHIRAV